MATNPGDNILVLAGTRDGLFVFEGTASRNRWTSRGPYLAGCDVSHAILDPRDGVTIWAAASGSGSTAVYRSHDRGCTWAMSGAPFEADQVWHVEPGHRSQPGRVYAGVKPAGLFASDDGGESWQAVAGLNEHPTSSEWWEGGAGKMVHTILIDPEDPLDLTVGISVAGVLRSTDGGESWSPHNEGTVGMADDYAQMFDTVVQHPGVHRCVHKIVRHPKNPPVLYQQNHDGIYRSDNRGAAWVDICDGVRDRFGFAIGITWEGSVFVVPQDMHNVRFSGQLTVYRLREGESSWDSLTEG